MKRLQQTAQVLGSRALITMVLVDENDANQIFSDIWKQINQFEKSFSRFLPESELTKFNLNAGKKVKISKEFRDILFASKLMSDRTVGIYNPFILPGLQRAGYIGSWPKLDGADVPDFQQATIVVSEKLEIGDNSARIPKNSAIDLGGIGKGYLLDQLAKFLDDQSIKNYWLSLGGDIICSGLDVNDNVWKIGIAKTSTPDDIVDEISNDGKKLAIATSGITKRRGENWHHLIDPATGKTAETNILTATVSADLGVVADVAAKCLVICGSENSDETAKLLPIHSMFLQLSSGKIDKVVLSEAEGSKTFK